MNLSVKKYAVQEPDNLNEYDLSQGYYTITLGNKYMVLTVIANSKLTRINEKLYLDGKELVLLNL